MTPGDEFAAITESIGTHAVSYIGEDHITSLFVSLNGNDMTARISVSLARNTEKEQSRALEKLFDVQDMFFDEVSMTFSFGEDHTRSASEAGVQRQFQYA